LIVDDCSRSFIIQIINKNLSKEHRLQIYYLNGLHGASGINDSTFIAVVSDWQARVESTHRLLRKKSSGTSVNYVFDSIFSLSLSFSLTKKYFRFRLFLVFESIIQNSKVESIGRVDRWLLESSRVESSRWIGQKSSRSIKSIGNGCGSIVRADSIDSGV